MRRRRKATGLQEVAGMRKSNVLSKEIASLAAGIVFLAIVMMFSVAYVYGRR
jgi:hypothetical protein